MDIDGLDYNTQRQKLKLMAYGRDIQQMVELCMALPTKAERQSCANSIIEVMRRVVPSQTDYKERTNALWYHLALMSDFKLDIDYPVDIQREDKMAKAPEKMEYANKRPVGVRHYGRLLSSIFEQLQTMPPSEERNVLAQTTAKQMHRCLAAWGMGTADKEKVVSDMARFTNGVIQMDPNELELDYISPEDMGFNASGRGRMLNDFSAKKKKRKRK